jgi:peptidoglycan/xylan/chitin deacetylase (PgdA/CDA1 family)
MKKVLLSFDIEEFDMPGEYGKTLPLEEQISVSVRGTEIVLEILRRNTIKATFFSTVVFAKHAPHIIKRIIEEGHELASHGYYHSKFSAEDLALSKKALEEMTGKPIAGFRMPRMMPVEHEAVAAAGYIYNSSLNPVYLPGRYNNFFKPRSLFKKGSVLQLPASATPIIRLPLFWLSFHNLPLWLYTAACRRTMNHDKYLNIYFHPWEFINLNKEAYGLPKFISKNTGGAMAARLEDFITWMWQRGYEFKTINGFLTEKVNATTAMERQAS